jgi:enoyl-[acyl-carrier-protein] reductase (NADH)
VLDAKVPVLLTGATSSMTGDTINVDAGLHIVA